MPFQEFILRLICALLYGAAIGTERQWRHRIAGLRTNALVCVGSALFVMVGFLVANESNPTRIAAQVVSGIGFLGAGVIIHSGVNVRGLNTAATIWCSSSVGVLAGSGFVKEGLLGTGIILGINLVSGPLVKVIHRQPLPLTEEEFTYSLDLACSSKREGHLRALLVELARSQSMVIHALHSTRHGETVAIKAIFVSHAGQDSAIENIAARLSSELDVSHLNWQRVHESKGASILSSQSGS